jgi:hypothetical protein
MVAQVRSPEVMLAAVFMVVCAAGCQNPQKGSKQLMYPEQKFNSTLEFLVAVQIDDENQEQIGWTPAAKPLVIPPCLLWWVRYEGHDIAALCREIQLKSIPGLHLVRPSAVDLTALQGLESLRMLYLEGEGVSDDGLANLKGLRSLEKLVFSIGTKVTDRGLVHIVGLKSLQDLRLGWSSVTDAGLAQIKELTALRSLGLSWCQITDAGLAHIQRLGALQRLSLEDTAVTDAGLAHLEDMKALQWLDLSNTEVTDGGMVHLHGLEEIRWLNLRGTKVTGAGLEHLKGLKALKVLMVEDFYVTDEAEQAMKKTIPGLKVMR